jgi:gluconate 2-dehydrogenase subunit 3-like protein
MSLKDPIDLLQDRRQWLKTSATMLGLAMVPASAVTAGEAQQFVKSLAPPLPHEEKAGRFFTPEQHALVEELSETIIPADSHSGGAKAAKVADYIEQTLYETRDDAQKALWRETLPLMDSMSQHYTGKTFVNASPEERVTVLTVLSDNVHMTELPEVRFFKELKRITVEGYYTSKIGIHDELEYKGNRILKEYVGCDDQGAATT